MQKILLFAAALTMQLNSFCQPMILSSVFGQNANQTDTIGTNTNTGGHLESFWSTANPSQNYISQSASKSMRYGGIKVEENCLYDGNIGTGSNLDKTIADYIRKAIVMQSNGITPMLTLPLYYGTQNNSAISNLSISSSQVAKLVKGVNDGLKAKGKPICTHWIYSNEPEDGGKNPANQTIHGYDSIDAAVKIHAYIKAYHDAVINVWDASWGADTTQIKFVGPELYSFDNYPHGGTRVVNLIDQLIGVNTSQGNNNILPYVNLFTFHYYPFTDEGANVSQLIYQNGDFVQATKSNVVNVLRNTVYAQNGGARTPLAAQLDYLNSKITLYNNTVPAYKKVRVGITEANLCYKNDVHNTSGIPEAADKSATGTSSNGQYCGMFWADLLSLCMEKEVDLNFWSAVEGSQAFDNASTDIGFLYGVDTALGKKKSTYYHFQMIAKNFKVTYCKGFTPNTNVKAFGSKDACGIAVMVMNQNNDGVNGRPLTIKLRNVTFPDSRPLGTNIDVYINAGVSKTYTDYINSQETLLILYDGCGNPKTTIRYGINNAAPVNTPLNLPAVCSNFYTCVNKIRCAITIGGSGSNTNEILTASKTITDSARISGTLTVPKNVVLTLQNAEAVFSPGAKIDVLPGGKLIINDSYLHGCEGQTWDGIKVTGSNAMEAQLIIARSKITDAATAVKADKTNGISITESQFTGGTAAIELYRVKGFTISNNEITQYAYGIKSSNALASPSLIKANYFSDVKYAAYFDADNHSQLDIKCNRFEHYTDYAIYSNNSTLKDQGSAAQGAGNTFVSSSTQVNDKLHHNGSAMKYYYDPSNPLSLITGAGLTAAAQRAALDGPCTNTLREAEENSSSLAQVIAASINNADLLNCFPNPASDKATIVYSLPDKTASGEIRITNLIGELAGKYKTMPGANSIEVNCSDFKNGIYFYSLISDQAVISTKKMVITK